MCRPWERADASKLPKDEAHPRMHPSVVAGSALARDQLGRLLQFSSFRKTLWKEHAHDRIASITHCRPDEVPMFAGKLCLVVLEGHAFPIEGIIEGFLELV